MSGDTGVGVDAEVPPKATRREWIGLGVIALACVLYVMDLTVLHLAVPAISAGPAADQRAAALDHRHLRLHGRRLADHDGHAGDRIGRRRLLMIGAAAFGVASVLAAFSTSAEMLIATRALLGHRGRDARAVDAVADPQHVPRPKAAHDRDRRLDHELLGRRRDRAAARRRGARVLLVGRRVPARRAGDGAAAGPRAEAAARSTATPTPGRPDLPSAALSLVAVLALIFGLKQIAQDGVSSLPVVSIAGGHRARRRVRPAAAAASPTR